MSTNTNTGTELDGDDELNSLDNSSVNEDPLLFGSNFGDVTNSEQKYSEVDSTDQFIAKTTKKSNESRDFTQQTLIYCPQSKYLIDLVGSHFSASTMDDLLRVVARMDSHILFLEKKSAEEASLQTNNTRVFDSFGLRSHFVPNTNFSNSNHNHKNNNNINSHNNNNDNKSENGKTNLAFKSNKLLLEYAKELLASELEIEKLQNELSTLKEEHTQFKKYHTNIIQQNPNYLPSSSTLPHYSNTHNYPTLYPHTFKIDSDNPIITPNDFLYQHLMKKEDELLLYHSQNSPNRKPR